MPRHFYFLLLPLPFILVSCIEEACFFPCLVWDICLFNNSRRNTQCDPSFISLGSGCSYQCQSFLHTSLCWAPHCHVKRHPTTSSGIACVMGDVSTWGKGKPSLNHEDSLNQSSIKPLFPSHWPWTKNKTSFHLMSHSRWRMYFPADITQAFKSLNVFQVEGPVLMVGNVININKRFLWWVKKDKTETSTMNLNK